MVGEGRADDAAADDGDVDATVGGGVEGVEEGEEHMGVLIQISEIVRVCMSSPTHISCVVIFAHILVHNLFSLFGGGRIFT